MKILKKAISLFLALAMSAGFALSVAACSNNEEGGGGNTSGEWNAFGDVYIGLVSAEACPGGDIDESKISKDLKLEPDKEYYMVIDFTVKPEYDNDGTETLTAQIEVFPSKAIKATLQEASTGTFTEIDTDGVTIISLQYKIPEKVSSPSKQRVTLQLTPLFAGAPEVNISFKSNGEMQGVVKSEQIKTALDVSYTKGLKYEKFTDEQTGKVNYSITGIGTAGNESEIIIPYTVDGGIVTFINGNAFSDNENLRKVVIPDSVTHISDGAFTNCPNLNDIDLPVTVGIRQDVFRNCDNFIYLEEDSANYIGTPEAPHKYLLEASGGNNFEIPTDTEVIVSGAFSYSDIDGIVFNENLKKIGRNAFYNNKWLKSIDLPDSVTQIGAGAFWGCENIKSVRLSENLKVLGDGAFEGGGAFEGCGSLKSIELPASLKNIWGGAFAGCGDLESLKISAANVTYMSVNNNILTRDGRTLVSGTKTGIIPQGVKAIDKRAFYGFKELESVTVPQGVRTVGDEAFGDCSKLNKVTLPSSLTAIGAGAFADCNIEQLNFPSSLTYIGNGAFVRNKLTEINLPEGVTHIGDDAFFNSTATKVTIPQSVKYLGASAFAFCDNLNQVDYNAVNCEDLEENDCPFEPTFSYQPGTMNVITNVNIGANVVHLPAYIFAPKHTYSRTTSVGIENLNFLGDKLKSIGECAFGTEGSMSEISRITIPSKIRPVLESATEGLPSYIEEKN